MLKVFFHSLFDALIKKVFSMIVCFWYDFIFYTAHLFVIVVYSYKKNYHLFVETDE